MREALKKLAPESLRGIYRVLRAGWIRLLFALCRIFPIRKNRVVLANVWGFGDNTKYITGALAGLAGDAADIIYVTDPHKLEGMPKGVRVAATNSVKAVYYLATARVWVDSNRKENYIVKRPGQYYIQTWHGSFPMKRIEGDATGLSEEYLKHARRDAAMTDLMITNGDFFREIAKRAFFFDGECADLGSPRMDLLLTGGEERKRLTGKVKSKLNIPENAVLSIYAPTFRDEGDVPELDLEQVRKAIEKRCNKQVYMVARLHPLKAKSLNQSSPYIINGNIFGDLFELLAAAELLISDYSGTVLEYAYTGGNVFLYAPDRQEYLNMRGLYFDYEKLPFPISETTEELCRRIEEYDETSYKKMQQEFFEKLSATESGRASRAAAELILRKLKEN